MSAMLGFMLLVACSDDLDQCKTVEMTDAHFTSVALCDEHLEENMLSVDSPQIFGACVAVPDRFNTNPVSWTINPKGDLIVKLDNPPKSLLVAQN